MPAAPRGRGCLLLLLVPFVLIALGVALTGFEALEAKDYANAVPRLAFAGVFGGAALLVWFVAWKARSRPTTELSVEPWGARPDWKARRIRDGNWREALLLVVVTVFWNAVSGGVGYGIFSTSGLVGPQLLFLVFPLIGLGLIWLSALALLRLRRYGTSTFELATLPAPPGRLLAGRVHLTTSIDPPDGFTIVLRSVRITVTGSGKNRSTHESVLWELTRTMPGALQDAGGISIPIALPIPADARETDERDSSDRVLWRLIVTAEVPGIDYSATFEVPVFRTAESETPLTAEELAALGFEQTGEP
ncbi:MAG: hypothetical protein ABI587_10970 [Gemmatimonadales bacterium]